MGPRSHHPSSIRSPTVKPWTLTCWPYQDCSNIQCPVLGLASCSRPAGQGPKVLPKLHQNWPRNCPVCVAMPARKGRGGGPLRHPPGAQEKLPQNCQKLMDCYYNPDRPNSHVNLASLMTPKAFSIAVRQKLLGQNWHSSRWSGCTYGGERPARAVNHTSFSLGPIRRRKLNPPIWLVHRYGTKPWLDQPRFRSIPVDQPSRWLQLSPN